MPERRAGTGALGHEEARNASGKSENNAPEIMPSVRTDRRPADSSRFAFACRTFLARGLVDDLGLDEGRLAARSAKAGAPFGCCHFFDLELDFTKPDLFPECEIHPGWTAWLTGC